MFINNWQLYRKKFIVIIVPEKTTRLAIHQYLENKYPRMNKTSLRIDKYKSEQYGKCWECDKLVLVEYHYGYEQNNIDEYGSGDCDHCGTSYSYEYNFDSNAEHRPHPSNNAIVIGDYFAHYTESCYHFGAKLDNETLHLINKCDIFIVNPPQYSLNKRKLGEYISNHLYEISNISDSDRLFELLKIPASRDIIKLIVGYYLIIWKKN